MSYESTPACQMIATDCACCQRPLLDAKSVETGMGPVCRKKHGFNEADLEVDFIAVAAELAAIFTAEQYAVFIKGVTSAREACNKLVYHIACKGLVAEVGPMIQAIEALGFVKLASILADRAAPVKVMRTATTIEIEAPFSEEFNALVRQIPTRRWVKNEGKKGGRNVISAAVPGNDARVFGALRKAFPGVTAKGPKGFFVLKAAS